MAKARILIVEDEYVVAEDLSMQLRKQGYNIIGVVNTGKQAIDQVKKQPPDLVLMDVLIRGDIDGIDAARMIQDQFSVPVIYLTAMADPRLAQLKPFDPCGYLSKPFNEDDLRNCIENALTYFASR